MIYILLGILIVFIYIYSHVRFTEGLDHVQNLVEHVFKKKNKHTYLDVTKKDNPVLMVDYNHLNKNKTIVTMDEKGKNIISINIFTKEELEAFKNRMPKK